MRVGAQTVGMLLTAFALCLASVARADGISYAEEPAPAAQPARPRLAMGYEGRRDGAVALGSGVFGVVTGALIVGGSTAIVLADDLSSETATRSVLLGLTGVSVPIVALGAWITRERTGLAGFSQLQIWGWTMWVGAVLNAGLLLRAARHDLETPAWITLTTGGLGGLGAFAHATDAIVTGRRANVREFYRIVPRAGGFTVRF